MKGIDYWDINQLSGSEEVANHKKKKKNTKHVGREKHPTHKDEQEPTGAVSHHVIPQGK